MYNSEYFFHSIFTEIIKKLHILNYLHTHFSFTKMANSLTSFRNHTQLL